MTTIAAFPLLTDPAANGRSGRVRGVEKSKARGQFDGEYAARQQTQARIVRASAVCAPCQSGTDEPASFWNGPRLVPAFAAQVIAQAMDEPRTQVLPAHTPYGERAIRTLPLFDENL